MVSASTAILVWTSAEFRNGHTNNTISKALDKSILHKRADTCRELLQQIWMKSIEIFVLLLHVGIKPAHVDKVDLRLQAAADETSNKLHLLYEVRVIVGCLVLTLIKGILHHR